MIGVEKCGRVFERDGRWFARYYFRIYARPAGEPYITSTTVHRGNREPGRHEIETQGSALASTMDALFRSKKRGRVHIVDPTGIPFDERVKIDNEADAEPIGGVIHGR